LICEKRPFFFAAGIFRSFRPRGPLDRPEEIEGQALEGIIAQRLYAFKAKGVSSIGQFSPWCSSYFFSLHSFWITAECF
jgi:hypothetical protein